MAAGAPREAAQAAAEELAPDENRFAKIETELSVLKWMSGTMIALLIVIVGSSS
jgi:hypothetical protein